MPDTIHGFGGGENETRVIFSIADAKEKIKVDKAEHLIESGYNDYLKALIIFYMMY